MNIVYLFPIPNVSTGLNRFAYAQNYSNINYIFKSSNQRLPPTFTGEHFNIPSNIPLSVNKGLLATIFRILFYAVIPIFLVFKFKLSYINKSVTYNLIPELLPSCITVNCIVCHDLTFTKANLLYTLFVKFSLAFADLIISISQSTLHSLYDSFARLHGRIRILPNDCSYIKYHFPFAFVENNNLCLSEKIFTKSNFTFIYVASHLPHKNHKLLISSLDKIVCNNLLSFDFKLILVGQHTNKLSSEYIKIESYSDIPDSHLSYLYSISDLYISPSKSEGFNYPIYEASAHKLPLLLSKIDCHLNLAPPSHQCFDPYDNNSLIECIINAFNVNSPPFDWSPQLPQSSLFNIY